MPKVKERILKAAREKKLVTYRGVPRRPSHDFSKETLWAEGTGKKYSISLKAAIIQNQINDREHKEAKNNKSEQEEKRIQKNEDSISSLWDNLKHSNIRITGVPEGEEKEQEIGNLFEKNNERKLP